MITKPWLREKQFEDVLGKLDETRIERLIAKERERRDQPALSPELEAFDPDSPLLPGRTLVDVHEEQYIGDLGEWKNVHIVETRSYVRDQALTKQAKKAADYT